MNDAKLATPLPLHPSYTRDSSSQKEDFDHISLNMISYLELYDEVTKVDVQSRSSKSVHNEIIIWEKKNFPYKVPADMKDFYSTFNALK